MHEEATTTHSTSPSSTNSNNVVALATQQQQPSQSQQQQQHNLQQIQQQSTVAPSQTHVVINNNNNNIINNNIINSNTITNSVAASSTTNVIVTANGGVVVGHHQINNLQQHQQQINHHGVISSTPTTTNEDSLTIQQQNSGQQQTIIITNSTSSSSSSSSTSSITSGGCGVVGGGDVSASGGNNGGTPSSSGQPVDSIQLIIPDQSLSDSAEIENNDTPYDDTSEGYQDNNNSGSNTQQGYISLLPPVGGNGNTSVSSVPCDQTDLKEFIEELCPVCGDKVSGYHYGLLTCESCKGFFKRTVQNKKVYTCVAERSCHIDKTQRKRCPFCRFQKCLEVGMKLEAVRADRMRGGRNKFGPMYKRDRARKLQLLRQRQLALQAIRGQMGTSDGLPSQLSPTGYQQPYSNMQIKQEIQIPQVSSLTSSPDSSPSPIALALSQVNPVPTTAMSLGGPTNSSSATTTSVSGLQNTVTDSKLWIANSTTASPHSLSPKTFNFDTGNNPSSTADSGSGVETLRVSPMIREFVQTVDDREWQQQLFSLLQSQSYNQCEVDLFELMCKVLDQNLFSQVDWARNTIFFKDLKVDDQMKLLQNSWSDMLVLDHLHHRIHNGLPDETTLPNGQKFDLLGLGLLGVPQLAERFNELQNKLQELKFDVGDYICMKFLLLLNPEKIINVADVRGITNRKTVLEGYENVQAALLDYTLTCYPSVTDKFSKLLSIIPEIHQMAARGEEHLYMKHVAGGAPTQTLLMEMLHAKRK